ncbi:hypothetical protein GQ44DRAFT_762831 [Phaeosphaeriaceae sp. PMI808]|nr:hypothetical protein GQ44DRAFT_762831 [Phaeosphaeriaceae sp. PMI808]
MSMKVTVRLYGSDHWRPMTNSLVPSAMFLSSQLFFEPGTKGTLTPLHEVDMGSTIQTLLEDYTKAVDSEDLWEKESFTDRLTSGHVLHKSTGVSVPGGEASWATIRDEIYAPFAKHLNDPQFLVVWEIENGWEILGVATLYWNLVAPGEGPKTKDLAGREWDGAGLTACSFRYVSQKDGGFKFSKTAIYADPSAMVTMLKRGMMKPEDLLK